MKMCECYEIVLEGEVNLAWFDWFDGLTALPAPSGQTRLLASLPDQSSLRAVLERVFDLNIVLIGVCKKVEYN
jgi:hypothetical protein